MAEIVPLEAPSHIAPLVVKVTVNEAGSVIVTEFVAIQPLSSVTCKELPPAKIPIEGGFPIAGLVISPEGDHK